MSAPAPLPSLADKVSRARDILRNILADLRKATDLATGEATLISVSKLFQLPLVYWVPDMSRPYALPQMDSFARARGWPDELLKLWWTRNAALKMPLYIRCRFEHLPFITSPSDRRFGMDPIPAESARITALIRKIGVTTFLVVPVHLPKGQVAMIVWAGRRRSYNIHNIVENIEGHLLAIGHHFMRIAIGSMDEQFRSNDEQSRLTLREWDCMRTIAQGYRETEIAQLMGISRTTVRFHLDNVVHKFGCKTKTQAVALLAQLGALGPIGQ